MTAAIKYEPRVYTDEFLEKLAGLYNSSVRLKEIARILGYKNEQSLGVALSLCRDKGLITSHRNAHLSRPSAERGMPADQRKRVEDAAKAGMDWKEIAEIEGVSPNSVAGHLYRQGFRKVEPKPRLTVVPKPAPTTAQTEPVKRPNFDKEVKAANDIFAKQYSFGAALQALRAEAQTLETRLVAVRSAIETLQALGEG